MHGVALLVAAAGAEIVVTGRGREQQPRRHSHVDSFSDYGVHACANKRAGPCPPPDTALIGDGDGDAEVDRHCQLPLASLSVSTGIHPRVTHAS